MIPTAEEFLRSRKLLTQLEIDLVKDDLIEFTKLHVEAALKAVSEKGLINRKPTGEGQDSDEENQSVFYGDLGYEDYIPVEYTINKESILNAYPLTKIK